MLKNPLKVGFLILFLLTTLLNNSYSLPLVCQVEINQKIKNPSFVFEGFKNNTPYKAVRRSSPDEDILEKALNEEFVSFARSEGFEIINFADYELIKNQQKFQNTGLFEEDNVPKPGKLKGSKYVLSGSIDNIFIEKKSNSKLKEGLIENLGIIGWAGAAVMEKLEKRKIEVKLSLKLINAESGETLFQRTIKAKSKEKFNYENLPEKYEAIKKVALKGLSRLTKELVAFYPQKAKVLKVKETSGKIYVFINKGKLDGIKKGDKFKIFRPEREFFKEENIDICNFVEMPVRLKIIDVKDRISIGKLEGKKKFFKEVEANFLVEKIK